MAAITIAGESLIAQKTANQETLVVSKFIFALVPDLNPDGPVDRWAPKPPANQVVYESPINSSQSGYVNPNQIVYSAVIASNIGDWDFNWIGLETAEGVLLAVVYAPVQQKRKNIPNRQIGNNITRNILLVFDGAQSITNLTVDSRTWQFDYTVRMAGIDSRERLANRDWFGRACFFADGLKIYFEYGAWKIQPGTAYVEGLCVKQSASTLVAPPAYPFTVWYDVSLRSYFNETKVMLTVQYGDELVDFRDTDGAVHYLVPVARVGGPSTITDLRDTIEPVDGPLIQHVAARNGDYPNLRARGTTKDDVGLGNLPNAKSDDPATNSSEILATTAALNGLNQQIEDSLVGMVASFDMASAPVGWLKRNGADVSRSAYAKLFAVIGTRYGAGDGTTTFNVGDSRGVFPRALDDGRGVDPERVLGSLQQSQNLYHDHPASAGAAGTHVHDTWLSNAGYHAHNGSTTEAGGHQHGLAIGPDTAFNGAAGVGNGRAAEMLTDAAGNHVHGLTTDGQGDHVHTVAIGAAPDHVHVVTVHASGGNESRPINEALLVCIKY